MLLSRRVSIGVGAVLVLLAGLLGGVAIADHEPDHHTFYACEKDGRIDPDSVRVDEEPECKGQKNLVIWNSPGPPGPAGPEGPPGPAAPGPEYEECYGTYLMSRDNNGFVFPELWAFSQEGNFSSTYALEHSAIEYEGDRQGMWSAVADFEVKTTHLAFFVDSTTFDQFVTRFDTMVTFAPDCSAITAVDLSYRVYDTDLGQDPLNPADVAPLPGTRTATGRLVTTP